MSLHRKVADDRSDLYIADTGNHRVMSYQVGASVGTIVAGGSGSGKNNTQLANPTALHYDV